MNNLPGYLVGVARVAGAIAGFESVAVVVVTCVLIVNYNTCKTTFSNGTGEQYFLQLLSQHYFRDSECASSNQTLQEGLLDATEVHIWMIIMLAFAILWFVTSIALITLADNSTKEYYHITAYTWSATTFAVIIVDLTTGVLFGIDFFSLQDILLGYEAGDPNAYPIDMLRMGSFLLMTLCLKGYILFIMNFVFGVLLFIYGGEAKKVLQTSDHSVHNLGPINAFATKPNPSDSWRRQQSQTDQFGSSGQMNRAYNDDSENFSTFRTQPTNNNEFLSAKAYDRSDSWQRGPMANDMVSGRPFSYLDEGRLSTPSGPTPSPAVMPPWKRGDPWEQLPTLPAPDYSPMQGRKLKSALKSAYM